MKDLMQTCKLIFPVGEVTEEDVVSLVEKNTEGKGIVHNFYPNKTIGCNKVAFSVVDIPNKFIVNFADNQHFKIEKIFGNSPSTCCQLPECDSTQGG